MRTWLMLGALIWGICLVPPVSADDQIKTLEERVKKLEQLLKDREDQEHEGIPPGVVRPEIMKPSGPSVEPGLGPLPEVGRDQRTPQAGALSFGSTGSGRLVYANRLSLRLKPLSAGTWISSTR